MDRSLEGFKVTFSKMTNHPLISVVICTYNRADLLTTALQTVCEQTLDSNEYEVIVVDNNSTDETRAISESFIERYSNVRYFVESQQGLSHARNLGWQKAVGQYVAYTDDDCKVPKQWLEVAKRIIEDVSPSAFGGPYFAFYITPKPHWYKDRYGSYTPFDQATTVEQTVKLYGPNLFCRRDLLKRVGSFQPELGMVGTQIGYGEESAMLKQIQTAVPNAVFYYDPDLFVYHLVRPEKTSLRWVMQARFINGRDYYRYCQICGLPIHELKGLSTQVVFLLLGQWIWNLIRSVFFRDRVKYPYYQNYWYESAFENCFRLGVFYEQWQQKRGKR